jgi:hypothetical protein
VFPVCLQVQRNAKLPKTALPSTLQSGFAPLRLPLVWTLKNHLTGHHYNTEEAFQEAVQSWLQRAGMDFYHRGIFKILQHWQKCRDCDGYFVEK